MVYSLSCVYRNTIVTTARAEAEDAAVAHVTVKRLCDLYGCDIFRYILCIVQTTPFWYCHPSTPKSALTKRSRKILTVTVGRRGWVGGTPFVLYTRMHVIQNLV